MLSKQSKREAVLSLQSAVSTCSVTHSNLMLVTSWQRETSENSDNKRNVHLKACQDELVVKTPGAFVATLGAALC